jgi:hypothetical protein
MTYAYTRPRTIDLVLADLCAHPVGTLIEDAVRRIAARIGRSAGAITPALKRLAADGWISYLADAHGTLIEVLRTDQTPDRSLGIVTPPIAANTAPLSPEPPLITDHDSDRAHTALGCDQSHDRSACMDDHDSLSQEEESARAPVFALANDPLFQRLTAEPRMNRKLAERIAKNPPGTVADFECDLRIAQTFAETPFFFTVGRWRDGQRVIAPEEPRDERPAERPAAFSGRKHAPNRTGRSAPYPRRDAAPPLTREYLTSRPRRGDRVRDMSGGGPAAGG